METDEREPFRIVPRPPKRRERLCPVLEMADHGVRSPVLFARGHDPIPL